MLRSSLVLSVVFGVAGLADAQVTTVPGGAPPAEPTPIRKMSQLIGSTVRLQGVDQFGRVEDVVLSDAGAPAYIVVSNNGQFAMFPWNAANINYGQRIVSYDVAPNAVQPLFFAPNAWPNITDPQFTTQTNRVFPNAGTVRRETLRPVSPGDPVVKDKEVIRPKGTVKRKEKIR
jgi:hypothetical protein